MSDLLKRVFSDAATTAFHADSELALKRVRDDISSLTAAQVSYTPADASDWDATAGPPSTVAEALDRLAAANPGA